MTEELVARMEKALKDAIEDFEKQVDRIVKASSGTSDDRLLQVVEEIRDKVNQIQFDTGGG